MFLILVMLVIGAVAGPPAYDSKFESIDIDDIINNDRILKNYVECFLDRRPCVKEAAEIKVLLADALKNVCARCTPKQIKMIRKLDDVLMDRHKHVHEQILRKYDPQNKYRGPFRRFLEENS
ncbi:Putative odorant-binding protein A10 [Eumeta japonica]|uniref:Odorant-binding protein A10 n=1 Tax=Eumeta variegata TaxID=151549 RepID=A0A4C1T0T4_EUMVA|nr:Putative odorant-binding protein A10 [Eumeta japonica]